MITNSLREDHLIIRRLRDIAKRCSDLLYEGADMPYEDIKEIIITIEEFIDRCHHGKEERSFFPALRKRDDKIDKEIDALLIEHEFGRRVASMISRSLDELLTNREKVARLLNAYVTFLDLHMDREERFFDLVDREYGSTTITNIEEFYTLTSNMLKLRDRIDRLESKEWYEGSN